MSAQKARAREKWQDRGGKRRAWVRHSGGATESAASRSGEGVCVGREGGRGVGTRRVAGDAARR